ncbi:MAG: ABC transporter ATP-binding protein [Spirochaetota bacterium]
MTLHAEDLTVAVSAHTILKQVSLSLDTPGITAVLGPNGAGKTTLLRCLTGMLKPNSGQVLLNGRRIHTYHARETARYIAYVPQRCSSGSITVFDAVMLGRIPHVRFTASGRDYAAVEAVLSRLQLKGLAMRPLSALSGGELQKVSIARALVQRTPILLLDEPTAALDLRNQIHILDMLQDIAAAEQLQVLITMHDLNTAFRYADQFVFLRSGEVISRAVGEELTTELIEAVYDVPVELQWHQDRPMVIPNRLR